jgi:hypothetical protein
VSCSLRYTPAGPSIALDPDLTAHVALARLLGRETHRQLFTVLRHTLGPERYSHTVMRPDRPLRLGKKKLNIDAPTDKDRMLVDLLTGSRCDSETSSLTKSTP